MMICLKPLSYLNGAYQYKGKLTIASLILYCYIEILGKHALKCKAVRLGVKPMAKRPNTYNNR